MPENITTTLATLDPQVEQQLRVVTEAISVSLGVRELTVDFSKRANELITEAGGFIAPPESDEQQEEIKKTQRSLAALRIEVTKQGEALKSPLNAARTKIIDIVKDGLMPIEKAEKRLEGFIQHRQQLLIRQQQERDAAAERERQRIANEAAAAQRALDDAERQRKAAELAAEQAKALQGKAKIDAEAAAAKLAAEATKAEEEAFDRALAAEATPEPVAAPVSELPMAKEVFDFEIIGDRPDRQAQSLIALAAIYPELFSAHVKNDSPRGYSLTLKIQDVTDKLNGRLPAFVTPPPGIKIITKITKLR